LLEINLQIQDYYNEFFISDSNLCLIVVKIVQGRINRDKEFKFKVALEAIKVKLI